MDTHQRVVRRSAPYSRALLALAALACGLLAYAVIWSNNQERLPQLLDVQSATAASLGAMGAVFARGQYARAVRPMIGWVGQVVADAAPGERLAWICYVINGAQDSCTVIDIGYRVTFFDDEDTSTPDDWRDMDEVTAVIVSHGVVRRRDFLLARTGPGMPLMGSGRMFLAWFTETALTQVQGLYVRLRVVDRVGDTHERVLDLLLGAERRPAHPDVRLG
ncbi:hypothetical protein ACFV6E_13465 [Streptomyces sp. NPDC059785]|uniref:hypothetical protein n=1 Tax=unclassified Streptomyces TaxID=2593676 RepID=UPI0036581BB6